LIFRINAGDVDAKELWIGGQIATTLSDLGANCFSGVKGAVEALKQVIGNDLQLL